MSLARRISRECAAALQAGLPERNYVLRGRLKLKADWEQAKTGKLTSGFKRALRLELETLFQQGAQRAARQAARRASP